MPKKKHLETELEREYRKARRRVQQIIRRAKKRGYIFPTRIIPEKPKRITKKSVERLSKITPLSIYKKATELPEKLFRVHQTSQQIKQPQRAKEKLPKVHKTHIATERPNEPHSRELVSETQKAYSRERDRIKQFIKRAKERGYHFPDDILPEKKTNATIEDVQGLQDMTPEYLYSRSTYIDPETGKSMSGSKRRAIERSEAGKKAYKTRVEREEAAKREAYQKEKDRAISVIDELQRTAAERGFLLPKDFLDELKKKVENDEMSTDTLQKITEDFILSRPFTRYRDPRTGGMFSGEEGLKREQHRKETDEKHGIDKGSGSYEGARVLEIVQDMIDTWEPSVTWTEWFSDIKRNDHRTFRQLLEGAINAEGEDVIAQRLQTNADRIIELAGQILDDSGDKDDKLGRNSVHMAVIEFSEILYGRKLTSEETSEITDVVEMNEYFPDM